MLNLYLVARTDKLGYDEYDSMIVAAESIDAARSMRPGIGDWTWTSQDNLTVSQIGIASEDITEPKVILSSFNAG